MLAIFAFFDISNGVQTKLAFSKDLRHVSMITYDGHHWVNIDSDVTGIHTRVLDCNNTKSLLRGLRTIPSLTAVIVAYVEDRAEIAWKPWWVRSCNELCRYLAGVDIGFTFNPRHLYSKLMRYDCTNYEILYAWRRNGNIQRRRGRRK